MITKEVELSIPGDFQEEPFFYYLIKNFNVIPSIQEASFTPENGWAIIKIKGDKAELERLFSYLEEKGVEVTYR